MMSRWSVAIIAGGPLLLAVLWGWSRRRAARQQEILGQEKSEDKKATKAGKKALKTARQEAKSIRCEIVSQQS